MKASSRPSKLLPRLDALWRWQISPRERLGRACRDPQAVLEALWGRRARLGALCALAVAAVLAFAGCQSDPVSGSGSLNSPGQFTDASLAGLNTNRPATLILTNAPPNPLLKTSLSRTNSEALLLREADTVRIAFPGSPSLNSVQQIRRDGKISLPMVGEVMAAGLTPSQLEKQLRQLYAPQLVDKEVTVTLESSAFQVFVTGAVARPGRLVSDRPLTALEAVIDAGVDYQKANLKAVRLIRQENGKQTVQVLNLQKALQGSGGEAVYLKPSDILFVREKFTWF